MRVCGFLLIALFAATAAAAQVSATETSLRTGVVIGKADRALTLWTKNGREKFTYTDQTVMPQRKIKDGNMVVVWETSPGSKTASRVALVDEEVVVTGKTSRQRAIIGRTHPGRSPGHLIIKTLDGKEAFVIDPKTFRQPLPAPNQRVAVTYRVENVTPPIYKATGIVVLEDKIDESPIRITYSDIPQPEPEVVAQVAEAAPEPEPVAQLAELPQTAGNATALALAGVLFLGAGLVLRRTTSIR